MCTELNFENANIAKYEFPNKIVWADNPTFKSNGLLSLNITCLTGVTVRCLLLSALGVIKPFFAESTNHLNYFLLLLRDSIIRKFFSNEFYSQQHFDREVRYFLVDKLPDRQIRRSECFEFPLHSSDLTE